MAALDTQSYYGDPNDPNNLAAQRKQQAVNAALVSDQNTVDPNTDPTSANRSTSTPSNNTTQPVSTAYSTNGLALDNASPTDASGGIPAPTSPDTNSYLYALGYDTQAPAGQDGTTTPLANPDVPVSTAPRPNGATQVVGTPVGNTPTVATDPGAPTTPTPSGNPTAPIPTNPMDWQAFINAFQGNKAALYTPGQLPTTPLPTYTPQQILTPDALSAQAQQFGLLQQVLNNPDAYSQEDIAKMQEAQKEQAVALQQSQMQKLRDQMAASGRINSGYQNAQARLLNDQTTQNILQGTRDVDLNAANANFQSKLNALNQANSVLSNSANLYGQQANEVYKGYQSQNDSTRYALQQALAQEGLNQAGAGSVLGNEQLALNAALGAGGLSLQQYQDQLGNNLGWYNSLSNNNNFLQNLMATINMFNAQQNNTTTNSILNNQ